MTTKISPVNLFDQEILKFPVKTKKLGLVNYVNLDNAATTPPMFLVQKAVTKYLIGYGSVHRGAGYKSQISTNVYEQSREIIKSFVNAPKDSYVLLTGNTTGAMNAAAYFFSFLPNKVAVSAIEHSSSWLPWVKSEGIKCLRGKQYKLADMNQANVLIQKYGRQQVVQYDVNNQFEFDLNKIKDLFKKHKIKAFVLTASSNATGYCPPIAKIGKIVHQHGAYFVVDACQFIQHHPLDMKKMGIDFLAASGHKFYAPYGGGFLIGPKKFLDQFLPYQIGGGNLPYITESGEFLRYANQLAHDPGTPNAVGAISMAAAFKALKQIGLKNIEHYEQTLTRQAYQAMKKNDQVELYVSPNKINTVIAFNLKGKNPHQVAKKLNDDYGIGVRAGSFCVYHLARKLLKVKDEQPIIKAVKSGDASLLPCFVRASFSICNTKKDADRLILAINELTK